MPRDTKRDDYAVGYGKPHLHTRFKRGQSGNPRGRPPGAKNLSTLLTEVINEPVVIAENGGRKTISKREAMIKQLVNKSANGDWRAVKILLEVLQEIEGRSEPETAESSFGPADEKVLAQLEASLLDKKPEADD